MNGNGNSLSLELDGPTAEVVEHLAQTWGVSKEEAVRRAVKQADSTTGSMDKQVRLKAFKDLQQRLDLTPAKAEAWQNAVRDARR